MKVLVLRFPVIAVCFMTAILLLSACRKEKHAKPLPHDIGSYVYAFSSGVISKTDPIRIQFAGIVATPEQIGQAADPSILSLSPSVEGNLVWEDRQTLLFQPNDNFQSGLTYLALVRLDKLYDNLAEEVKSFEFEFKVREQLLAMNVDFPYHANPADLAELSLDGYVVTADAARPERVEKTLTVKQNGRSLKVNWRHPEAGNSHDFTISGIQRGEKAGELLIDYDGAPIGARTHDQKKIEIPARGDFKLFNVKAVGGASPHLVLHFSDPLKEQQNLAGLVSIVGAGADNRFLVKGNQMLVYPVGAFSGERTVVVDAAVQNNQGKKLGRTSRWTVSFTGNDPQLRLVGTGVIMPEGDGLLFPFEAIGLNAVEVEVFKVYSNNILQFLQNNDLGGNNELNEVGQIVARRKVALFNINPTYDAGKWTRYALDLRDLITEDKEAIYQIRLGFRPEYAANACVDVSSQTMVSDPLAIDPNSPAYYGAPSIMDLYYGFAGYYAGYRWDQRDDPCSAAYYNADRFVARNAIAGNLGITVKSGNNKKYLIAITDLLTTDPIAGAEIEFYDYQQQLLGTAKTESTGFAELVLDAPAYVLIAKYNQQKGYLRLRDGESLAMSAFQVAGSEVQEGLKGFMYADRGVWRPGDSVFLNFVIEDQENILPPNYPVHLEVRDARGQVQVRRTITNAVKNIYPLHFDTAPDDPTGMWSANLKAGGASFSKSLRIETIRPNRLKIALDTPADILSAANESNTVDLQASWLYGAPASGLKAEVEMSLQADPNGFEAFEDYVFQDPGRSAQTESFTVFDGNLNGSGEAEFDIRTNYANQAPGMLRAGFRSRVFEPGGDFSTDNLSLPYSPYASYTGVRLPENKWGNKQLNVGEVGQIELQSVNEAGEALANRNVSVGLYRVEWRWWWDDDYDNLSQYNSQNHLNAIDRTTLRTDGKGKGTWNVNIDDWGRYLVRVCDTESGHCAGDFFYAGSPRYGNDNDQNSASVLFFSADKEKYAIGQTVKLTLPTPDAGRALVSLEDGTGIIRAFWVEAKAGETEINFEATPDMAPTVYAHVSLLQPHQQTANDLPIRLYGVLPVKIEDPATHLNPEIKMPESLRPDDTYTVEVKEAKGTPMAYTLAVVDEGLLGLTRFATPDPWSTFYAQEALGVRTWDLYDQVMGAYEGAIQRVLSVGGDGELVNNPDNNEANRFKPVVKHYGPFALEKGGKAKHNLKIENYVGAVRVMVVAANEEGAYGHTSKTVPVKKPLMVLSSLPRMLSPGETLTLPVNVFTTQDNIRNVNVGLSESSGLVQLQNKTKALNFSGAGDQLATFSLQVGDAEGIARFKVSATGGGETATETIEIAVRNPNNIETRTQTYTVEPGQRLDLSYAPFGSPGTREGILEVSNLPPINLGERLAYLLNYPYGCLEQTLSGGFPQLYVNKLIELDQTQKERTTKNITATLERLKRFQQADGGFTYWPGNNGTDQWSTSYAGHFLLEAKALGYSLPPGMLDRWRKYQKKAAKNWSPSLATYGYVSDHYLELSQAYRLYTLALADAPDLASMNQLREKTNLAKQARWRLAAAYARAGKKQIASQLIQNLETDIANYRELSGTYGSDTRDRAMILETLLMLDDRRRADALVQRLSKELSADRWLSTQDISFALLAIGKYVGDNDVNRNYSFSWQLAGQAAVDAGGDRALVQLELPTQNGAKTGVLQNTSQQRLFVSTIVSGQPLTGAATAASENLRIEVRYLNKNGQAIAIDQIDQGTDFVAEVKVTHPASLNYPYAELALSQIFPGGWEINNIRMDATRTENNPQADYRDYRDDRVNTFFDLAEGRSTSFRVNLTAAYIGRYYLPPTTCEAMYDRSIYARVPGQWVEVVKPAAG